MGACVAIHLEPHVLCIHDCALVRNNGESSRILTHIFLAAAEPRDRDVIFSVLPTFACAFVTLPYLTAVHLRLGLCLFALASD